MYGYWRGDDMIRLCADIIRRNSDPQRDFVGHVGGDDFVMLQRSPDWHERIESIIAEFNRRAVDCTTSAAGRRARSRRRTAMAWCGSFLSCRWA